MASVTASGIAYDREGPRGEPPVVLIHAGVADRGMWDPIWPELTAERDVVRMDLRGFGDSTARPAGAVSHPRDVLETLSEIGVDRCHVVGAFTRQPPIATKQFRDHGPVRTDVM